jgi:hypothetical protein
LRVDDWALLAVAGVAGEVAGVLFAVEQFLAGQLALVDVGTDETSELAAYGVASVDPAMSLLPTDGLAEELFFQLSFVAFDLPLHIPTSTELLHHNLAFATSPIMADFRTLMPTSQFPLTRHPTTRYRVLT